MYTKIAFGKFLKSCKVKTTLVVAKINHTFNSAPMEGVCTLLPRSPFAEKHGIIAPPSLEAQMDLGEEDSNDDNYKCKF